MPTPQPQDHTAWLEDRHPRTLLPRQKLRELVDDADREELRHAADLEQLQQEDTLYPWLADGSMADYVGDENPCSPDPDE